MPCQRHSLTRHHSAPCVRAAPGGISDWEYEVFISHAGEDKELARNLAFFMGIVGIRAFVDQNDLRGAMKADACMLGQARSAPVGLAILSPEFFSKTWPMRELEILMERDSLLPMLTSRLPRFTHEAFVQCVRQSQYLPQGDREGFAQRVTRITHMGNGECDQLLQQEVCWAVVRLLVESICPRLRDSVFTAKVLDRVQKAAKLIAEDAHMFGSLEGVKLRKAKDWLRKLADLEERLATSGITKYG